MRHGCPLSKRSPASFVARTLPGAWQASRVHRSVAGVIAALPRNRIFFSEELGDITSTQVDKICGLGLEGIVSKDRDAPYRSGRTGSWIKVKCVKRETLTIIGFVPSTASIAALYPCDAAEPALATPAYPSSGPSSAGHPIGGSCLWFRRYPATNPGCWEAACFRQRLCFRDPCRSRRDVTEIYVRRFHDHFVSAL
jgi:hypothetical protein